MRSKARHGLLWVPGLALVVFVAAPFAALFAALSPRELLEGWGHPLVGSALRLSLLTSSLALCIVLVLGTPLAWTLAQGSRAHYRVVEHALRLPMVLPPAVAGLALLLAFGRQGFLARTLGKPEWSLSFTTAAVVVAQVFVAAPLYVQTATVSFRRIDERVLVVARTLGASPWQVFAKLALPLAGPGLVGGAALGWSRALGEFGATLMFAGSLEGRTQTLPLAVYAALETDVRAAEALSILLVMVSFVLLATVQAAMRRMSTDCGGSS